MNRIILSFIFCVGLLVSCTKQQITNTTTTSASEENLPLNQLPQQVVTYVENNYPDATISSAVTLKNSNVKTIVRLTTNEEVAFDSNHRCVGNGDGMHPGGPHGRRHDHHDIHHAGDISVDSLDTAITNYINTNYSGYSKLHAHKDSICIVGNVTSVLIRTSNSEPVKLVFDATNNLVYTCSRITYTNIPQAIQDSVTVNYSGFTIKSKSELMVIPSGTNQYRVFIKNTTTRKYVIFDDSGNIICEQ
jgi:hypothetical protein